MKKIFNLFFLLYCSCNYLCSQTNFLLKESGSASAQTVSLTERIIVTKKSGEWKSDVFNNFRLNKVIGDVIKHNKLSLYSCSSITADNGVIVSETNSLDQYGNSVSKLTISIPATMSSNVFTMTVTYSLGTSTDISNMFKPNIAFPIDYSSIPSYIIGNYYLEPGVNIESNNVVIANKALEITSGATDLKSAIELLASWITANITYSAVTTAGYTVLMSRFGNCEGQSKLMIAFCRSLGIPARLTSGNYFTYEMHMPSALGSVGWDEGKTGTMLNESVGHAVYEVYYPSIGWVRGDPAMNTVNFGWPTLIKIVNAPDASLNTVGGGNVSYIAGTQPPVCSIRKTFSTSVTGFSTSFAHSKTKVISGTNNKRYLFAPFDDDTATGFYDKVTIQDPPSGTTRLGVLVSNNTTVINKCVPASFYAKFITDNNPTTYANTFDWSIVLYHSGGEYIYARQNNVWPNAITPNFWGESCVWNPTYAILPAYNWALYEDGSIYGIVKVTAHVSDGTTQYCESPIGFSLYNNIQNVIYNTNTTINACAKLVLTNVTVSGTPTVTLNTNGLGATINGPFKAPLGSKVIINK